MLNSELYLADLNKIHSVIKNIEELNNKSIFITGATGLIGSAIVDYLIYIIKHKNYKINITVGVRSISSANIRFGKYIEECGITCIKYDASKPTALNGCFDFIIHAASPATPSEYVNNPVDTMLANFVGINSILEYAVKSKNTKKVLYISSSEVYGIKSDCKPYSEREYGYLDILNNRAWLEIRNITCNMLTKEEFNKLSEHEQQFYKTLNATVYQWLPPNIQE